MTAVADALADALSTPRWCLNCGHDERVPITAPARVCCPEPEYKSVQELMLMVLSARSQILKLREQVELHAKRLREMDATIHEMEKYRQKREADAAPIGPHPRRLDPYDQPYDVNWERKKPKWRGA